ncbi:MAG: NRDE family protein [Saprospiraceae bacterium]|nr:NRDE family protein [Saprospiraceae bacterium]
MCTVTYIPQAEGWLLTSNRDEDIQRDTDLLVVDRTADVAITYPPDEKGGSWIAASSDFRCVCLLNGAFERHQRQLPYRHSRGKILMEAVRCRSLQGFLYGLNLTGIEPFTLVFVDKNHFLELIWDGMKIHIQNLNRQQKHIWSSSTLYGKEVRAVRKEHFDVFAEQTLLDANKILSFHHSSPFSAPEIDFIMKRPGVQTLSITQVECENKVMNLRYKNLANGHTLVSELVS